MRPVKKTAIVDEVCCWVVVRTYLPTKVSRDDDLLFFSALMMRHSYFWHASHVFERLGVAANTPPLPFFFTVLLSGYFSFCGL